MIKKGVTILSEKPYAFVLKSSFLKEKCNYCFTSSELKKCSQCQYVYYCSKNCQRSAWSIHKLECTNLAKMLPNILPDSAHLIIRIILKLNMNANDEVNVCQNPYNAKYRTFTDLMSHYEELKEDQKRMEHFHSIMMILISFFGEKYPLDEKKILEIFGKMCINSFNILDNDMNSIGTGIYITASILDHSCEPNAVAVFEGTTIHIRTIKSIPNFQWNNAKISYIDVLNHSDHRKHELQSMYYFLCDCERCYNEDENNLMKSMICPEKNCSRYVYVPEDINSELRCVHCQSVVSKALIDQFREVTQLFDDHLENMKSTDVNCINVCELMLNKQESILYELNLCRVKTLDLMFEACVHAERWQDAMNYGDKLLPGFRTYYRKYHPLVGLLNMKLLKLMLLKGDILAAKTYYDEAKEILSVSHGNNHPLFKNLQEIFCSL